MRVPLIAGNWKMNATLQEAASLASEVVKALGSRQGSPGGRQEVEVVLCPPFTALGKVAEIVQGARIGLGAQNLHWEPKGAFTGEVSAPMLKDVGCTFSIIGHSERRGGLGETDSMIHRKVQTALRHDIAVILCVGETLPERQQGKTWQVVEAQLSLDLEGIEPQTAKRQLVIAYEPVWAIGTGHNATPPQAQEVQGKIRQWLTSRLGADVAGSIRILYGGSVKPENALELLSQPDVDGALVGGASLDGKAFLAIVESAALKPVKP